uniref:Uncharacterized protein n=1 Tax=Timema poppense TaxID=170557 RepID=A0A7R9D457_TIMPO|nr:unnamed protein product [Timema poppensis]
MVSACKQAIPIQRLPYVGEDSANIFGLRVAKISLTLHCRLNFDTAAYCENSALDNAATDTGSLFLQSKARNVSPSPDLRHHDFFK